MKKLLVLFCMAMIAFSVNAQSNCPNANNPQHKCNHQVTATTQHQCQNAATQQKSCANPTECQHKCQGNAQHQCHQAQANQPKACPNASSCQQKCQGNANGQHKCSKETNYKVGEVEKVQKLSPDANKMVIEKVE